MSSADLADVSLDIESAGDAVAVPRGEEEAKASDSEGSEGHASGGKKASLASQLWLPFHRIVRHPFKTAVYWLTWNAVFSAIWNLSALIVYYLHWYGFVLLLLFGLWRIAHFVCRAMCYPGSLAMVRRSVELSFTAQLVERLGTDMEALQAFAGVAMMKAEGDIRFVDSYAMQLDRLRKLQARVKGMAQTLAAMDASKELPSDGQPLLQSMLRLSDILTTVLDVGMAYCDADTELDLSPLFDALPAAASQLHVLLPALPPAGAEPPTFGLFAQLQNTYRMHRPLRAVGGLKLMRHHLRILYGGQQQWIRTSAFQRVDSMFFRAPTRSAAEPGPALLLCCPNGGLYEHHFLQCDWVPFFLSHGISVLVYNYRGYGRTSGSPSPKALRSDGEALLAWLGDRDCVTVVGVHGESIGGVVASHVAARGLVQLYISDRNFSNIPRVGSKLVGRWAGRALAVITQWNMNNVDNYLAARTFKVCACDPDDKIIGHGTSLAVGVAHHFLVRINMPITAARGDRWHAALDGLRAMAGNGRSTPTVTNAELRSLLARLNGITACLGAGLLPYHSRGPARFRYFLSAYLVWQRASALAMRAPRARRSSEVDLVPTEAVLAIMERMAYEESEHLTELHAMLRFLVAAEEALAALEVNWAEELGTLLPLSCGHNSNYRTPDKALLKHLLSCAGWLTE